MNKLRLYKVFYCISIINQIEEYTLIDVEDVFVDIYDISSNVLIESVFIQRDSLGVYYIDINHFLYNPDNIYEIIWNVKYTIDAPLKKIKNKFKLYNQIIGQNIDIELLDNDITIFIDKKEVKLFNDNDYLVQIKNDNKIKIKENSNNLKLNI